MQPLQENIKKDLIKHPFRNIEIIYEAGKTTLSAQDEELIASYIRLHDFEWELKNTAHTLYKECVAVNKTIEALHEELKEVQATFNACCALADKLSAANYIPKETSLEKLAKARQETENELKNYHEKILKVYETAKVLQEKINEYHEVTEDQVEAFYDEITTLSNDHIANWENNAINAVAFDQQFDEFREYRTFTESQRETLMSECDEAMENYTKLNNETTALYNVWNEFVKRCELLSTMSDLHDRAMWITEN